MVNTLHLEFAKMSEEEVKKLAVKVGSFAAEVRGTAIKNGVSELEASELMKAVTAGCADGYMSQAEIPGANR